MKLRAARLDAFAIPLRRPLRTAGGTIERRCGVLLRLEAEGGTVGAGEAAPHPLASPQVEARDLIVQVRAATSWLEGASLDRLADLLARARSEAPWIGAAIDVALHDLAARASGRSVVELLGGRRRGAIEANATLVADRADEVGEEAAAAAAQGFAAVKLKLSRDLCDGAARVRAVRARAPLARIRVDANGAWTERQAGQAVALLAAQGVELVEQPLPPHDLAGLARLRQLASRLARDAAAPRSRPIEIAADEAVTGAAAVQEIARRGAADVVVLKLCQTGGLAEAMRAADAAHAAGLASIVTTALDTSLATAAALHLAAALPGHLEPCGLATTGLLDGDLVARPIAGAPRMPVPSGPGLGVQLDETQLARWRLA
jgi:L-alanine-DL-glutamate epimerase-like enolase superfamily enzyme